MKKLSRHFFNMRLRKKMILSHFVIALIPLLIPARDLSVYPLQVAAGAAVLIAAGMLLGRRKRSAGSAVRTPQQQNAAGACF